MEPMGKLPTILTSLIVATILGFRAGLGISGVFCFFCRKALAYEGSIDGGMEGHEMWFDQGFSVQGFEGLVWVYKTCGA